MATEFAARIAYNRRKRQVRLEYARCDEIASVEEIGTDYSLTDRQGDLLVKAKFQELYNLVDREEEKSAVARAFAVYQHTERNEDQVVLGSVGESANLLREHNPLFLGAFVPDGSDGAA